MADISATLFKFRQFIFEYAPFFLAAWLGLAVVTGLIAATQSKRPNLKVPANSSPGVKQLRWLRRVLFFMLWRPAGKAPVLSSFSGMLLFSLAASIPALVATSLLGLEIVLLRLVLAVLYALLLNWFATSVFLHKHGSSGEQQPEIELTFSPQVLKGDISLSLPSRLRTLVQSSWKSFIGQIEGAVIPLAIGLILASALTIYVPAYAVRPWLGEGAWQGPYIAALLTMPFQLTGGAEVLLASALLVKGASLGTVLSVMLVAPSTIFSVIRHLSRPMNIKTMALYLIAVWLVASSLGVAVDGVQRILSR